MSRLSFLLCAAAALPACVGSDDPVDPGPEDPGASTPIAGSATDAPPATPAVELARLTTPRGGTVVLYAPTDPGEISIGVGATYPEPPPVTGAFILRHNPIEVFLAVAAPDAPVPAALAAAYPKLAVAADASARTRLRAELAAELVDFPVETAPAVFSGSCTNSFISWFNNVYKSTPDEGGTCSTQGASATFHNGEAHYYQDDGAFPITEDDDCSPYVAECDFFKVSYRDWRWGVENFHGNSWGAQNARHDMHTGMAMCAGAATFKRQWGGTEYTTAIANQNGWHQYIGRFPSNTGPAAELIWGLWSAKPPTHFARSEITDNAASADRAIWCANLEDKWSARDESTCHEWCDLSSGDGCNGCFKP